MVNKVKLSQDATKIAQYERHKASMARRSAERSAAGREIGELPPVVDPDRKNKCEFNLQLFLESYFSSIFNLKWSNDHLKVIGKMEKAILKGGLYAIAMPRGHGKSRLCEGAAIWATSYGHRKFVVIIGATEKMAAATLKNITMSIENNDVYFGDFPEVAYPVRKLDGLMAKAKGQTYLGARTRIEWLENKCVFPTIEGYPSSSCVITSVGITSGFRGLSHTRADGISIRPDFIIPDDPQTDESANSIAQSYTRESLLCKGAMGLAGPKVKISGVMPCTVICENDMASKMLDRDLHPEWSGEKFKLIEKLPDESFPKPDRSKTLWDRYAEILRECVAKHDISPATNFYKEHQEDMDRGAVVSWPERFNEDEISAVQFAMNIKILNERAFWSEYQNEPKTESILSASKQLNRDDLVLRTNGLPQRKVPNDTVMLTAFIDVQENSLWYTVVGWDSYFGGSVVDHQVWPKTGMKNFTMTQLRKTLTTEYKGAGLEGKIYNGLSDLVEEILGSWTKDNKTIVDVERCLVDASWGYSTDTIYKFCKESKYSNILMPSHGRYIGASSSNWGDAKPRPGERRGLNWKIPSVSKRDIKHVTYDTNFWKTFIYERLTTIVGDHGALLFNGKDITDVSLLCDHLVAEYRIPVEARGKTCDEWKLRPTRPDNHWFDGIVGCAVGASMLGLNLHEPTKINNKTTKANPKYTYTKTDMKGPRKRLR